VLLCVFNFENGKCSSTRLLLADDTDDDNDHRFMYNALLLFLPNDTSSAFVLLITRWKEGTHMLTTRAKKTLTHASVYPFRRLI